MGNCLKTQLKETVNNSSLKYLGCIQIKVTEAFTGDQRLSISGTNFTVDALNGTFDIFNGATGKTSNTAASNMQICPRTAGMTLLIKDKYNIGKVTINAIGTTNPGTKICLNYDSISYVPGVTLFNVSGSVDDVFDLSNNAPNTIYSINNGDYSLSLPKLYIPKGFVLSEVIVLVWVRGNNHELELNSLRNSTNLSQLSINGLKVTGELTELLDALYNSGEGKTTGTLVCQLSATSCTYNGNPITATNMSFTFTSEGWSLNS